MADRILRPMTALADQVSSLTPNASAGVLSVYATGDEIGTLADTRTANEIAVRRHRTAVHAQRVDALELETAERTDYVPNSHRPTWCTRPPTRKANGKMNADIHQATF